MTSKPFLESKSINQTVAEKCSNLYPVVMRFVYIETRPKLNVVDMVEDDVWRYEELPKALESQQSMTKIQLARLVKWKITHGVHRPFLPGMIQKNTEAEVQEHTEKAASLIKDIQPGQGAAAITSAIEAALKQVCNLKSVGPATGTLVLSVFQPKLVPFFEDELYFCLHPDHTGKLKYDKAEYKSLLVEALDIVLNQNVEAQALEKTAYVLMHADKLSDDAKKELEQCLDVTSAGDQAKDNTAEAREQLPKSKASIEEAAPEGSDVKKARARRKIDVQEDDDASLRRSKRRKP